MIDLSIVIVSHQSRDLLAQCLSSIEEHPPTCAYEVVVVDNASSDGTADMIRSRFPDVRLVENATNAGFGRANNRAVELTTGDLILFQNSDCFARPGLYDGAVERFERDPWVGVLGPELVGPDNELLQMSWGWPHSILVEARHRRYSPDAVQSGERVRAKVRRLQRSARDVPLVCGACMFVRRDAFVESGRFDENIVFYVEEADFCTRVSEAGWRIRFDPAITAVHLVGGSTGRDVDRSQQLFRQSQLYFYAKHRGRLQTAILRMYLEVKYRLQRWRSDSPERRQHLSEMLEVVGGRRRLDFETSELIEQP